MEDFFSWLEDKKQLNEYGFIESPQKPGDLIFFGIHLLSRLYTENSELPPLSLGFAEKRFDISKYVTEIIDVDLVRRTVIIRPDKKPFALGYRARHINVSDRKGQIHLPLTQLEEVTFLLPENNRQRKLWVVITNSYQRNIATSLRRKALTTPQKDDDAEIAQPQANSEFDTNFVGSGYKSR